MSKENLPTQPDLFQGTDTDIARREYKFLCEVTWQRLLELARAGNVDETRKEILDLLTKKDTRPIVLEMYKNKIGVDPIKRFFSDENIVDGILRADFEQSRVRELDKPDDTDRGVWR